MSLPEYGSCRERRDDGAQILVGGSSWEIRIATAARFRYTVTVTTPWERPWDGAHRRRSWRVDFSRRPAAFSLIELLITLALIIIMAVMLYGFGSRSNQQRQKKACQKNLQTIYVALEIFANERGGAFPTQAVAQTSEEPLSTLVPRYTVASEAFVCPGSKDSSLPTAESFAKRKISYAYFMGRQLTEAKEVLMTDRQV